MTKINPPNHLTIQPSSHVHFIGICGYLMNGVAITLKEQGYKITGSDQDAYPPTTTLLKEKGINWHPCYSPNNLKEKPDLVIIGNHISPENPEAKEAIKQKLKILSLPELIYQIFKNKKRIVVAGTHGKTTTTSMIAWILQNSGLDPSYLIGGIMKNTNKGYHTGQGKYVVIEGDEYRTAFFDPKPKILHYCPDIAVLTTCELDHPDYFKNLQQTKKAFLDFLEMIPRSGFIVLGVDDPNVFSLQRKVARKIISYGVSAQADYQAKNITHVNGQPNFEVVCKGKRLAKLSLQLPGLINIQNALAAVTVCHQLKISVAQIKKALASFPGARRRFEVIGIKNDIVIVDDYAHHPTKILATLKAAQEKYPQKRIIAVFEPHTYSRTKVLFKEYLRSLKIADKIIFAPLLPAREKGQPETVTSKDLVKELREIHPAASYLEKEKIVEYLINDLKKGDVVVIMSVSGLDNLAKRLFNRLKNDEKS